MLRHEPTLLVRIALNAALALGRSAFPWCPGSVPVFGVHVAHGRIVNVPIIHGPMNQPLGVVCFAQRLGESSGAVIEIGIFQSLGNSAWHKTEFFIVHPAIPSAFGVIINGLSAKFISPLYVITLNAF